MTAPAADRQYGTVIWNCDPRHLLCPADHLYQFRAHGMLRDQRRITGHDFFRCEQCKPPSHFFVIFSTTPDPHATAYLISEACWKTFVNEPEPLALSTLETLYLLRDPLGRSYNPNWRPKI